MGIFNFYTETIINNLNFTDINGNVKPRIVEITNPREASEKIVKILQLGEFPEPESVTSERTVRITKCLPVAPVKEVMTLNFTGLDINDLKGKVIQLQLDMILQGSQDGAYGQFAIHKGEPFYCEYFVKASTVDIPALVTDFTRVLNSYFLKGDRKQINVTSTGSTITLTATTQYQRFKQGVIVQVNSANDDFPFVIVEGTVTVKGSEGKGNYWQIVKNLRLPTIETQRFGAMYQDEKPIIGAQYTQYTLFLESDRSFTGSGAVGQKLESKTEHTILLLSSLVTAFETAIAAIIPTAGIEVVL